jgi:hypothetical protein
MSRYILFNTINDDGIGDFIHFEEIVRALQNMPMLGETTLIAIVYFSPKGSDANYEKVLARLESLNITYYFGKDAEHAEFRSDRTLLHHLSHATQAFVISYDTVFYDYCDDLKQGIPIKFIGEHDRVLSDPRMIHHYNYSMSLSKKLPFDAVGQGIKLMDKPKVSSQIAFDVIKRHDKKFTNHLLHCTKASDFENFKRRYALMPAYFNRAWSLIDFLRLFSINQSYEKQRDLVVYHSGCDLRPFLKPLQVNHPYFWGWIKTTKRNPNVDEIKPLFQDGFIHQLQIFFPESYEPLIIEGNPLATQKIVLFSGFNISDCAYEAMFQLANIAGVSGDNTFERCISMNVFPFYRSTNHASKARTFLGLQDILLSLESSLPKKVLDDYLIFFNYHAMTLGAYSYGFQDECYAHLDIKSMIAFWNIVTDHLKEHYNFYHRLSSIVQTHLPEKHTHQDNQQSLAPKGRSYS